MNNQAHEAWHSYCQANPTKSGKQRPLIQRNAFLDGYAAHTQEHAKRARTEAIAGLLDLKGMGEAAEMVRNEFQRGDTLQQKAKIPDDHKRRLANELISELRSGKWEVRTCDILERSTAPIDTSASFKTIGAAKTDPHGSKRVLSFTVMPELALDMPKYLVAIDADGYDDARDWLYMYGLLEAFNTLLESRAYPFRPHMKGYGTNKQASMRRNEAVNPEASKAALMVLDYCVCETV